MIAVSVGIGCLVAPVVLSFRSPDSGDLAVFTVRHPAVDLEVWVPPEVALQWALGERALPPLVGHVVGIPIDRALIRRWMERGSTITKEPGPAHPGEAKPSERQRSTARPFRRVSPERDPFAATLPLPLQAPVHVVRQAWRRASAPARRAGRIETFSMRLTYGTGDPATTGMLSGFFWEMAAALPPPFELRVEADWMNLALRVEGEARAVVFPWRAIWAAVCLGVAGWSEWRRLAPPLQEEPWQNRMEETAAQAPSSRS